MTGRPITLVVVDDHPTFRIGMCALLAATPGLEVVGEAADQEEAVAVVGATVPDVVIMDLDLGVGSGVEATREILAQNPEVAVLVVTMLDDDHALGAALQAGALGYVLKEAEPAEIERSIRSVAGGGMVLGRGIARRAMSGLLATQSPAAPPFPQLTDREGEVLTLIARGLDNAAIARTLFLTTKTVRNYVYAIFTKLDVNDRASLVVKAREAGVGLDATDRD